MTRSENYYPVAAEKLAEVKKAAEGAAVAVAVEAGRVAGTEAASEIDIDALVGEAVAEAVKATEAKAAALKAFQVSGNLNPYFS